MPANRNDRPEPLMAVPLESRPLNDAAQRALAEAEARQKARNSATIKMPEEKGGPSGPEPTRYGDWERKGIASDF